MTKLIYAVVNSKHVDRCIVKIELSNIGMYLLSLLIYIILLYLHIIKSSHQNNKLWRKLLPCKTTICAYSFYQTLFVLFIIEQVKPVNILK